MGGKGVTVSLVKVTSAAVPFTTPGLWLTGLERGVMLAALAVALGGLAGRGLSRQYKGERAGPLPGPWALRGALAGLAASVALGLTAAAAPGLAARLATPAPPGLPAGGTLKIAAVEAGLFAAAAIAARLRRPGWAAVLLCGVVAAEGVRSHPEGVIPVAGALVTYCHLLPAVLWAGMLCYALRAGLAWRDNPPAMQGIIRLYATAAAWLFTIVVGTGVISALILVPVSQLLHTAYGLFLLVKAAAVGAAAGLAYAGRRWLRGRPETGAGPARATRLEVSALAVVLMITGLLTVLTPPNGPASAPSVPGRPAARDAALIRLTAGHGVRCAVANGGRPVPGPADEVAMRVRMSVVPCTASGAGRAVPTPTGPAPAGRARA
jgi:copper transport protein